MCRCEEARVSVFSDIQRPVVVQARTVVADGVVALDLVPTNGRPLPPWTPGSHIDLLLPGGVERQYSLCGDPADRTTYRVAVLREQDGRGGSAFVHDELAVGDTLRLRGPRNHFAFDPATERPTVFVAGGIGITPLLSMLAAADAAGTDWSLHYAGRSRVDAWRSSTSSPPSTRRACTSTRPTRASGSTVAARGRRTGRARCSAAGRAGCSRPSTASTRRAGPCTPSGSRPASSGRPCGRDPFEVELALSGATLTVPPGESILDVVEDSGAVVVSSCRVGTCGSCETPVLRGGGRAPRLGHRPGRGEPDDDDLRLAGRRAEPGARAVSGPSGRRVAAGRPRPSCSSAVCST